MYPDAGAAPTRYCNANPPAMVQLQRLPAYQGVGQVDVVLAAAS